MALYAWIFLYQANLQHPATHLQPKTSVVLQGIHPSTVSGAGGSITFFYPRVGHVCPISGSPRETCTCFITHDVWTEKGHVGLSVQSAFYSRVCRFIGKFAEADMKQPVRMWGIESDQTRSYRSGRPACHSETTYFLTLSPCSPMIGSYAKHYTAGSVYLSNYMICGCLPFTCKPNSTLLPWRHQHRIALYLAAYVSEDLFVSFTTGQWSYLCSSQVWLTTAQDCFNL